jgi:regulator of protease activity HflC (stomatin/prohibitin superfamily)
MFALGCFCGLIFLVLTAFRGCFFTVDQNERAVKTSFGRAQRVPGKTTLQSQISLGMVEEERERYQYPQLVVIPPGGPYIKFPWEEVHKVSIATQTVNMAFDPETPSANHNGQFLEAVTKDQLDTSLTGQLRFRVCETNLYAYLFGVKNPIAHVMGYLISVLRERIANYEAKQIPGIGADGMPSAATSGVSINDLRKNLHEINEHMMRECVSSSARYGVALDASLITSIDPPAEVERALAAINTAYNEVSSDISLAQAGADQKIVQSRRATEIETLRAQSEVEPLTSLAEQLRLLKKSGSGVLPAYLRNVKQQLLTKAERVFVEVKE